jgi:hypothetical protein
MESLEVVTLKEILLVAALLQLSSVSERQWKSVDSSGNQMEKRNREYERENVACDLCLFQQQPCRPWMSLASGHLKSHQGNQGENPNKTTLATLPEHSQNQWGQRK